MAEIAHGTRRIEVPVQAAGATAPSIDRVIRTRPETPMVDVMSGDLRREIRVLDHGFVALVDAMPRLVPEGHTADSAIVQAARVSYGQGTKKVSEDRGLVRYLLRHRHTTPFEMVEFKFHVAMPIFIARQWIRHRTANVNEYSGRYSMMPDQFYRPALDAVRKQSRTNKQGGSEKFDVSALNGPPGPEDGGVGRVGSSETPAPAASDDTVTAQAFQAYLAEAEALYHKYTDLAGRGVSRELARIGLPVSQYTQWYWKCDLHNILRFLSLRMDSHAQEEIRAYAQAMHDLIAPIVPVTMEAWRDYELQAVHLTRLELDALRELKTGGSGALKTDNKREQAEWDAKRQQMGL